MASDDIRAIAGWLVGGARSAVEPHEVLAQLCDRLVGCGIPLWRAGVFVRTLHPNVAGRRFLWRSGEGVAVSVLPFEDLETAEFRESPVARVYSSGAALRCRLDREPCDDMPLLRDLRAEGATDYLASPLVFTNGEIHAATWTTRQSGGFTPAEIAGLESIVAPFARVAEIHALRRTAANLLDTYVGHRSGARILAGRIRRGDTEAIHAAIWLSDMRGFTVLADRLSPRSLIDLLNRYFNCQVPAILDHGGKVLKFMGDGLLAIFPIAGHRSEAREVCQEALAAACEARGNVAALDSVRFGLALHLGEVLYGNIGGGNRLDFTCIGPAVNLAARLEKLAAKLGRVILASSEFARHCQPDLLPLGEFALPGFTAPERVFGLGDDAAQA